MSAHVGEPSDTPLATLLRSRSHEAMHTEDAINLLLTKAAIGLVSGDHQQCRGENLLMQLVLMQGYVEGSLNAATCFG